VAVCFSAACVLPVRCLAPPCTAADSEPFARLGDAFTRDVQPLLEKYCLDCHAADIKEGELDLERFVQFDHVRSDPAAWQKVAEFLGNGEMPPADATQPSPEERARLQAWIGDYLDAEARAGAGDPGPIVLRRLNNAEYTYTIRDLTGVPLDPVREFPADGAAGEGFTNAGSALVMSPALAEKYLTAAKEISAHMVLLPRGIGFSERTTRSDWTNERLYEIRRIYARHTSGNKDLSAFDRWSMPDPLASTEEDGRIDLTPYIASLVQHRDRILGSPSTAASGIADNAGLNGKFLGLLIAGLTAADESSLLLQQLQNRWLAAGPDDVPAIVAEIDAWQNALWKFNTVGHLGYIQPWQEAVAPVVAQREFRTKLAPVAGTDEIVLYLVSGTAGVKEGAAVTWRNPRLERSGASPIRLRDVRGATAVLERTRHAALEMTEAYLAAAWEARHSEPQPAVDELASRHDVEPAALAAWLAYLGVGTGGEAQFGELLTSPLPRVGGYDFASGWGIAGIPDLSLVANSSDQPVNIPGELRPRSVVVHPRPDRWVAAGWRSPIDAAVQVAPRVRHAHPGCGNGVS
jgi:hypothetical protein